MGLVMVLIPCFCQATFMTDRVRRRAGISNMMYHGLRVGRGPRGGIFEFGETSFMRAHTRVYQTTDMNLACVFVCEPRRMKTPARIKTDFGSQKYHTISTALNCAITPDAAHASH